jgi:hypothetical protein
MRDSSGLLDDVGEKELTDIIEIDEFKGERIVIKIK